MSHAYDNARQITNFGEPFLKLTRFGKTLRNSGKMQVELRESVRKVEALVKT
jgi:hypothetical protein